MSVLTATTPESGTIWGHARLAAATRRILHAGKFLLHPTGHAAGRRHQSDRSLTAA